MKIAIIGSGNVATQMGLALKKAGQHVVQVYSRTMTGAERLATLLECAATTEVGSIVTDADAYIFSVKDDALPMLAEAVCARNAAGVYLHTAGSVGMNVFEGRAEHYGVLYPMQTFSKERMVDFREIPCFTECNDDKACEVITSLAESIAQRVVPLSSERRKSLHLAAVFACNFTNHCYALAEKVLAENGLDFDLYLPLIDETARKVHEMSPVKAQTGPAVRYDETVINRHLAMLQDEHTKEIYRMMSESIHRTNDK